MMSNWKVDPAAPHTVEGMICQLANNCDGARQHDQQGFSGADTEFGHSLAQRAQQGRPFTLKQAQAALKMVNRYRRQLGGAELVRGFLETPVFKMAPLDPTSPVSHAEAKPHNPRRLLSEDKTAVFQFPYSPEVVESLKAIRGEHKGERYRAQWEPSRKVWLVPVNETSIWAIMDVADRFEFEVEARFTTYLERVREKTQESRVHLVLNGGQHVTLADDTLVVSVDNAAILKEIEDALT